MKKYLFLLVAILVPTLCMAQGTETSEVVLDFGSFTGIVAAVSMIVTQVAKVWNIVTEKRIAKIGVSAVVGMILCMVIWLLQIPSPLTDYVWWEVLIYGIFAGLAGCGFYDLIKSIGGLFSKPKY